MTDLAEQIARVIDPVAFTNALIDPIVLKKAEKNALEKAHAILSLPAIAEVEKLREAVRQAHDTLASDPYNIWKALEILSKAKSPIETERAE